MGIIMVGFRILVSSMHGGACCVPRVSIFLKCLRVSAMYPGMDRSEV